MTDISGKINGEGRRVGIVVSRFNELVTRPLLNGARDGLRRHGVKNEDVTVVDVPGAWEISGPLRKLAKSGKFHALIALGAVIRGETPHFDYVAGEAARAVAAVGQESEIPVVFGVLTTDTFEQALDRSGGKAGNKGWDCALVALEMADLYDKLNGELAG
jgi:6,7-dimethyl-8-ribityllumazine synthase